MLVSVTLVDRASPVRARALRSLAPGYEAVSSTCLEIVAFPDQYSRHSKESDVWAFGITAFVSLIGLCGIRRELTPLIAGAYHPRAPLCIAWRSTGSESYRGS